jgi:hypothetical protein
MSGLLDWNILSLFEDAQGTLSFTLDGDQSVQNGRFLLLNATELLRDKSKSLEAPSSLVVALLLVMGTAPSNWLFDELRTRLVATKEV